MLGQKKLYFSGLIFSGKLFAHALSQSFTAKEQCMIGSMVWQDNDYRGVGMKFSDQSPTSHKIHHANAISNSGPKLASMLTI